MRIRVQLLGKQNVRNFQRLADRLRNDAWEDEARRGLIDAGRKVRSRVAKAATKQAGFRNYSEVAPYMRGTDDDGTLNFRIFAVRDGARLDAYKGLKVLAQKGRAAASRQKGRGIEDRGGVLSAAWNHPRIFKRSFATERGQFAVLPPGAKSNDGRSRGSALPPALWTFGAKEGQPRGSSGKFAAKAGKAKGGKIRRLFGPSLRFEIVKGDALETFATIAPVETRNMVEKRLERFLKF